MLNSVSSLSPTRALTRGLSVASICLLALSGCAVDGTDFRPGVAVQVGDDSVSVAEINEIASDFCVAVSDQITAQGSPVPLSLFLAPIATQQLTLLAIDQLADQYGLEAASAYRSQLALLEQDAENVPEEGREAFVDVQASPAYVADLLVQIGAVELDAVDDDSVDDVEKQAAGEQALGRWLTSQDVSINPRYGIGIVDGQVAPVDGRVSVAVSDLAKQGDEVRQGQAEPDPAYVAALTDPATCG